VPRAEILRKRKKRSLGSFHRLNGLSNLIENEKKSARSLSPVLFILFPRIGGSARSYSFYHVSPSSFKQVSHCSCLVE